MTVSKEQKALENRMAMERRVVRKLLAIARKAGWLCATVNDGERYVICLTHKHIMETVFSVDESGMRFVKTVDGRVIRQSVSIVLGNDGYDAIADHSTHPLFLAEVMEPMDEYTNKLEEKACC
jgi:hypothetical protein